MQEEGLLDLKGFIAIIKKGKITIILITLILTIMTAVICCFVIPPVYESTISVVIGKVQNKDDEASKLYHYDDVMMYQKLIKTYAEIAQSKAVAEDTIQKLNLNITYEDFKNIIIVKPKSDTQIIEIKIKYNDAKTTKNIADTFIKCFIKKSGEILPDSEIKILDNVQENDMLVKPNKKLYIAAAFIISFLLSIIIVLLKNYFDDTMNTEQDIEKKLNLSVLGSVPEYKIKYRNTNPLVTETYRSIMSNIQYSSLDKKIKTILVTSAVPGEGKSTVVYNIALAAEELCSDILVIDCDLRKPDMHKQFNISNKEGLSDYIGGRSDFSECVYKYQNYIYVMTSGNFVPNPIKLLSSNKFKEFLNGAKDMFELVIIDSPPLDVFSDAYILSNLCDGVIISIYSGKSHIKSCMKAQQMLSKTKNNIIGVVLNRVKLSKTEAYYPKYY